MAVSKMSVLPTVTKYVEKTGVSVAANDISTVTMNVSDAVYQIIKGFSIFGAANIVIMQCYFASPTSIQMRCRNVSSSSQTFSVFVNYC